MAGFPGIARASAKVADFSGADSGRAASGGAGFRGAGFGGADFGDPPWSTDATILSVSRPVIFSARVIAIDVMTPTGPTNSPLTSKEPTRRNGSEMTSPVTAR